MNRSFFKEFPSVCGYRSCFSSEDMEPVAIKDILDKLEHVLNIQADEITRLRPLFTDENELNDFMKDTTRKKQNVVI